MKNYTITLSVDSESKVNGIVISDDQGNNIDIPGWDIEEYDLENTSVQGFVELSLKYLADMQEQED